MNDDEFPAPASGFVITHFLVVSDQDRSREFYQSVFGATVLVPESTRSARFACDAERPMEAFRKAVHGPPARKERLPRMGSPHCHRSGVA